MYVAFYHVINDVYICFRALLLLGRSRCEEIADLSEDKIVKERCGQGNREREGVAYYAETTNSNVFGICLCMV